MPIWIRRFRLLLVGGLAVFGLSACGNTTIRERHILQVRDDAGRINYYRLTIEGDATLAKTHYRAGLYDAQAVDALMGGPGDDGTKELHGTLHRLRVSALNEIATLYFAELAKESPDNQVLNRLANRVYHLANTPSDMLGTERWSEGGVSFDGTQPRKFVVMYSALASAIEEAIADFVEEERTQQSLMAAISGEKRDEYIRALKKLENLKENELSLRKAYETLSREGGLTADEMHAVLSALAAIGED